MPGSFVSARFHADDNFGKPLVGGRLYTYADGTTTPIPTYQDAAGTILNTNPIILDGRGEAIIYLADNQVATFVLQSSSGVGIWTQDGISGLGASGGGGGEGLVSYATPPATDVGPIYWIGHGPAEFNGSTYVSNYQSGLQGGGYSFKNVMKNGDFISWSTGNTSFTLSPTNSGTETADYWYAYCEGAARYSLGLNPADGGTQFGVTGRSYMRVVSTAAATAAATDAVYVAGAMIGYDVAKLGFGSGTAGSDTLSFRVRCTTPGQYCATLMNGARNRSYVIPFTITLANTFERKVVTVPIDTLVPANWEKTGGTGLLFAIDLGSGANYDSASPNTWQTGQFYRVAGAQRVSSVNGTVFDLTEVQIQAGIMDTPFEPYPLLISQMKGAATLTDMQSLTARNKVVTAGALGDIFLGGANQLLASGGFKQLPGGLIIQWGSGVVGGNSTIPVNFAKYHPNQCFSVVASPIDAGTSASYRVSPAAITPGSFTLVNTYVNTVSFNWISVGF